MGNIKRRQLKCDASPYKVGYGNPPKHTQFKPGQSGHPVGRPQGVRNYKTIVKAILKQLVKINRHGKSRKIPVVEAALLRLCEKALSGDFRAIDRFLQLAETHSAEEVAAAVGLEAADAELLRIYRKRVLDGAAANIDVTQDDRDPNAQLRTMATSDKRTRKNDTGPSIQKPDTDDSGQGE
jgi:Family of unknown function (DUF5681)